MTETKQGGPGLAPPSPDTDYRFGGAKEVFGEIEAVPGRRTSAPTAPSDAPALKDGTGPADPFSRR